MALLYAMSGRPPMRDGGRRAINTYSRPAAASVTGPRKARGRQYTIGFVLAVIVSAVLVGASNYSAIARRARDISQGEC